MSEMSLVGRLEGVVNLGAIVSLKGKGDAVKGFVHGYSIYEIILGNKLPVGLESKETDIKSSGEDSWTVPDGEETYPLKDFELCIVDEYPKQNKPLALAKFYK